MVKGNPNANGFYKTNLIKMITEISLFVNVGKNMDIHQIKETANLLHEKCMALKIEDLILFSKKFRTGEFGKLYDRLDGTLIIEAMDIYFEKRMTHAESIHIQEHHRRKKEAKDEECEAARVEVRAALAVLVNEAAVGEQRAALRVEVGQLPEREEVHHRREEVVRVRRAARNRDDGLAEHLRDGARAGRVG